MKRIKCPLIFFALFLAASAVRGSDVHWEFAGWYGGGCFPNLVFDPQNKGRVYLTSDVAGIWRSDDLGEHWHFITKGLGNLYVPQVAVAPSDSNVLYAATGNGIYISRNAGDSWQPVANSGEKFKFKRPDNYRSLAIDPQNPDKICAGTAKGKVFCSNNAGGVWRNIDPNGKYFPDKKPIAALSFDGPDKLLAASPQGLSRCMLFWNTCENLGNGLPKVTDFVYAKKSPKTIYAAGDNKLWISRDDGISWVQSQAIPSGKIFRISLDEAADQPVLRVIWNQGWKGGVFLTRDEGQHWQQQDDHLQPDLVVNPTYAWASKGGKSTSIQVDPFNPQVVFRTDWWGVWRSDDGGQTWNSKVLGAPNTVATDVLITPKGEIYASSMDNGLLRSADNGKSYEPLFPSHGYDADIQGHVWRVMLDQKGRIIATSSPWGKDLNQVIVSDDAGRSFNLARTGLPTTSSREHTVWDKSYPRALAIDPKDDNTVYLGIDGDDSGGLFISKDGGKSWNRSTGQPGSLRIYHGLAVDPTDPNRIVWGATGTHGGVYISNDKGKTFQYALQEMPWVFNVVIGPDGTIYAGGDKGGPALYVSNSDKRSFRLLKHFDDTVGNSIDGIAVNPQNTKMIAVSTVSWSYGGPCQFYLSRDGGQNWESINGDLPDGSGASSMKFDPQGKYLVIARYAGSIYKLDVSHE